MEVVSNSLEGKNLSLIFRVCESKRVFWNKRFVIAGCGSYPDEDDVCDLHLFQIELD